MVLPSSNYIHPDEVQRVRKLYEQRIAGKKVTQIYETILKRKTGNKLFAELSAGIITYQGKPADLVIVRDITERKKMEENNIKLTEELNERNQELEAANIKLKELSIKDGLTKIYNRRFFQETLLLEYIRAKRRRHILSFIMFDIDDFKKINDIHGHSAGDFILMELVSLVNKKVRKSDIFARYGGEEFAILLSDNNLKTSIRVAEKIRRLVEDHDFIWRDIILKITISLGVASTDSEEIDSKEALLETADRNLLIAKKKGKNCVYA